MKSFLVLLTCGSSYMFPGKSGVMFPVPDVVKEGTYGGSAGWGAKKDGKKK